MSNSLIATTEYIAEQESLLIRIDMSAYLIDYYLHRKGVGGGVTRQHDEKLKELIACFAAHLSVHSANEAHAWTVHMIAETPFSLFVTGALNDLDQSGAAHGYLVGNVLTDHIRHTDVNSFHGQFTDRNGKSFRSYVKCESSEVREMVEHFYRQSEQQPLRISVSKDSDRAIALAALPGYHRQWFETVNLDALAGDVGVGRKLMRTCAFDFACDCSPEKLLPFFRSLTTGGVEELYGDDDELTIVCPRCGNRFPISRSEIE